jgi:hypothetical protein
MKWRTTRKEVDLLCFWKTRVGKSTHNVLWHNWKEPLQGYGTVNNSWANNDCTCNRGAVFSVRSVPRLYAGDQLPLRQSLETAVRRVGGWCEMAASLRGREPRSGGSSTVGRRYQAAQWRPWLRTVVFVWLIYKV